MEYLYVNFHLETNKKTNKTIHACDGFYERLKSKLLCKDEAASYEDEVLEM